MGWLVFGGCGLGNVSVSTAINAPPPPRSDCATFSSFVLGKWSRSTVLKALPGLEKLNAASLTSFNDSCSSGKASEGAWLNVASCGEGDRHREGSVPPGPVRMVSAGAGPLSGPGLGRGLKKSWSWSSSSEESTS